MSDFGDFFGQRIQAASSGGREADMVANCGTVGPVALIQSGCVSPPFPLGAFGTGEPVLGSPAAMGCLIQSGSAGGSQTVTCAASSGGSCLGIGVGWATGPIMPPDILDAVPGQQIPGTDAPAGTWIVPLNVTAKVGSPASWQETWILVVDGSGSPVQTIAHGTGSISLTAAGVYSMTMAGAPAGIAYGESIVILLVFSMDGLITDTSFTFTSDQTITSPLQWAQQQYEAGVLLSPGSSGQLPVVIVPRGCGEYRLGKIIGRNWVDDGSGGGSYRPLVLLADCCPDFIASSGGIASLCCPGNPIPATVYVTFVGALAALGTIALEYGLVGGGGETFWYAYGPTLACSTPDTVEGNYEILLACIGSGPTASFVLYLEMQYGISVGMGGFGLLGLTVTYTASPGCSPFFLDLAIQSVDNTGSNCNPIIENCTVMA